MSLPGTENIFGLTVGVSFGSAPVLVFICLSVYSRNSVPHPRWIEAEHRPTSYFYALDTLLSRSAGCYSTTTCLTRTPETKDPKVLCCKEHQPLHQSERELPLSSAFPFLAFFNSFCFATSVSLVFLNSCPSIMAVG